MRIVVIGAGAWGTALASLWAGQGHDTTLLARDAATAARIRETGRNAARLPDIDLAAGLATGVADGSAIAADCLVLAVPAQATAAVCRRVRDGVATGCPAILCAKGIDRESGQPLSKVVDREMPGHPVAALSGPSFAADVARGLPTAVVLAADDQALARTLAGDLAARHLRVYPNDDLIGVEVGGAVKNVLAIACGISDGLGLGASAKAALTARGFAEMRRFAAAQGGRPETLSGLSGLGDLVLTCSSRQSRNMALGVRLGEGMAPGEALAAGSGVCEGAATAPILVQLARNASVDMPIVIAVDQVLAGRIGVRESVEALLSRPPPTRE